MNEGFYAIYYTGIASSGLGLLAFKSGTVVGVDAVGGTFDGQYSINEEAGKLEGVLTLKIPAGAQLVTGGPALPEPFTMEFPLSLPLDLGDGKTVQVSLPTGPVNVVFKWIRSFPADHQ